MTRNRVTLWALLIGCQIPLALYASGLGPVLKNSPFANFTDADYKQFFSSAKQAADGPVGGPSIEWSNADSGARGSVRSTRAFQRQEGDCRELRGDNAARGRADPFRVTVCKGADGQWLLAPNEPSRKETPPAAAAKSGFPILLPASFTGVLPCADCRGLSYHVEFHEDGTYRLRKTYQGRGAGGADAAEDDAGAWQLVSPENRRVTLRSDNNTLVSFSIKDGDSLRLLDANGVAFKSNLNYELKRSTVYAPIEAPKQ